MHATLVTFEFDEAWDREELAAGLEFAVSEGLDEPGLRFKTLLDQPDGHDKGGFYLFESRDDAEEFFDDDKLERYRSEMGAEPQLRHFGVPGHVDNVTGEVLGMAADLIDA